VAEEVGHLRASLSANSAGFAADMKRARDAVQSSASGMSGAMNSVKKSFGTAVQAAGVLGAAATAGAGALAYLVKGSIDSADAALKQSQAVGVSVATLTSMQHAANLSGVSNEALATALKQTSKRASEAASGTGAAAIAYAALGISVLDSSGSLKGADKLIGEVADKFAGMENGAGKTAIAMQLFGRAGADMIPLLNAGGAGIQEMRDEARALGLVMDDETSAAAERFNDNIDRLIGVKQGLVNQITKAVLPTLEAYSNSMVTAAKETDGMGRAGEIAASGLKLLLTAGVLLKTVFDVAGTAIGAAAAAIMAVASGEFKQALNIVSMGYDDFIAKTQASATSITDIWNTTASNMHAAAPDLGKKIAAPVIASVIESKAALAELEKLDKQRLESINSTITGLQKESATLGMSADALVAYELAALGATEGQKKLAAELTKDIETKRRGIELTDQYKTSVERVIEQVNELSDLQAAGAISAETYNKGSAAEWDSLRKKSEKSTNEMSQFQVEAARNMQDAFAQFLFDPFSSGVEGMAIGFAKTLQKMMADLLAQQLLTSMLGKDFATGGSIGGWIGGLMPNKTGGAAATSGSSGGGWMSTAISAASAFFGGGKAIGGPVGAGGMYEVNERGPELLEMGNRQFLMMGSQPGNVNPDISGAVTNQNSETNIRVINVTDAAMVADFMSSPQGEQVFVNMLSRHGLRPT